MDTTKMTSTERMCYGKTKINRLTVRALSKVLPQLKNHVGKKVKLATGDKAKSFQIELLSVPHDKEEGMSYRTHLRFEYQRLTLFNDITLADKRYESGGYGVTYYKKEVEIARIDDSGVMVEAYELDAIVKWYSLDKKYDAKTVEATNKKIEELEKQIRELKYTLPY